MGTRADFYVGRGADAEWLGSIAYDGYPRGVRGYFSAPATEAVFRRQVAQMLANREYATTPDLGWPWPWNNSQMTDYAYCWDDGNVWTAFFGGGWVEGFTDPPEEQSGVATAWPDMSSIKRVTLGPRSGLIVIQG